VKLIEISVDVDGEAAEAVSAIFNKYGQGRVILGQEGPTRASLPHCVKVKAFLPAERISLLPQIKEALWHLGQLYPIPPLSMRWLLEMDWAKACKSEYTIQRIGRRIVIKSSWLPFAPTPDQVVVELDPGLAFGTGLHPSTRLCLVTLEDYLEPGDRVLDVGTGSGILSIAAAKLGADHVVALDIDGRALGVARENVARNGVQGTVSLKRASLSSRTTFDRATSSVEVFNARGTQDGTFDLVLMNILPEVILESTGAIATCLSTNGLFVVSGIIRSRESFVSEALNAADLTIMDHRVSKDWVALIGRKENGQSGTG